MKNVCRHFSPIRFSSKKFPCLEKQRSPFFKLRSNNFPSSINNNNEKVNRANRFADSPFYSKALSPIAIDISGNFPRYKIGDQRRLIDGELIYAESSLLVNEPGVHDSFRSRGQRRRLPRKTFVTLHARPRLFVSLGNPRDYIVAI